MADVDRVLSGVAVALAARRTLENLIGGVTLFADKPVRVGDFCRFGDKIGTVEEIGLRSTAEPESSSPTSTTPSGRPVLPRQRSMRRHPRNK